jgi:hypothetical protein
MLSVNSNARTNYAQNKKPRLTDSGSQYDALYKGGEIYLLYDPVAHGIWEITPQMTVRRVK